MPFSPESAFIACRFAHFLALMLLFGESAFIAFIAPRALQPSMQRDGRRLLVGAAILMSLSALVMVPVQAAQMGDGWQDAPRLEAWQAVLQTAFGKVWAWHLILSIGALMLTIAVNGASREAQTDNRRNRLMLLLALTSAVLLASLGLIGHAAMHAGWRGALQRVNHATHLLSAGAWFGALAPLLHCLRRFTSRPDDDSAGRSPLQHRRRSRHPNRRCSDANETRDAVRAVRRFSTMGHVAVGLVILTGVVNTALVLQGWPIHLHRPYEVMLDIKIALVAVMTAIAVYNRYRWVPALKTQPDKALSALERNTYIEIALGCAVLLLVATFATDDPQ